MTAALRRIAYLDQVSGLAKLSTLSWSFEIRYRRPSESPAPWDPAYEFTPRDVAYRRWRAFTSPLCAVVFNAPAGLVLGA